MNRFPPALPPPTACLPTWCRLADTSACWANAATSPRTARLSLADDASRATSQRAALTRALGGTTSWCHHHNLTHRCVGVVLAAFRPRPYQPAAPDFYRILTADAVAHLLPTTYCQPAWPCPNTRYLLILPLSLPGWHYTPPTHKQPRYLQTGQRLNELLLPPHAQEHLVSLHMNIPPLGRR